MPKKFQGENSKAVVAKARKAAAAAEEKAKKDKEAEDNYWKEDDKLINKKFQRREEREKKRLEDLQRKTLNKELAEQEIKEIAPDPKPQKITVYQLQCQKEKDEQDRLNISKKEQNEFIEENLNRLETDVVSASGIDAALSAMTTSDEPKPKLSLAAAFKAFEEKHMPAIKKEYPKMKLSQQKDMLRKKWTRSPENPLNMN